jgi:hypothetical protein
MNYELMFPVESRDFTLQPTVSSLKIIEEKK